MLNIYLFCIFGLTLFYAYLMMRYYEGWTAMPIWNVPKNHVFSTKITLIIPVRDEAKNITACLQSILNQDFPKALYEIIVVNDHSTDETVALVQAFASPNIKVVHLADFVANGETQSFKKKGIEIAISQATGALILTTDGDCVVGDKWLPLMVSYYEVHRSKLIAGPVNFYKEKSVFEKFQSLDFAGMIVLTGASIHRRLMNMCNGANLAYEKQAFLDVGGFSGIDKLASGDDMMLMQKIAARYPDDIGFVKNKEAVTFTEAKPDWKSFYQQRVRWASKSTSYQEFQVTVFLGMVWVFCVSIPFTAFLSLFFGVQWLWFALAQLAVKSVIDYFYLKMSSRFFNREDLMQSFLAASAMHLAYIIFIGALGNLVKTYEWKGRKVQ